MPPFSSTVCGGTADFAINLSQPLTILPPLASGPLFPASRAWDERQTCLVN